MTYVIYNSLKIIWNNSPSHDNVAYRGYISVLDGGKFMPTFDMKPVEVSQEILDALKEIPTATIYNALRSFGSTFCVCEGIQNFTPFIPGKERFAARARTL